MEASILAQTKFQTWRKQCVFSEKKTFYIISKNINVSHPPGYKKCLQRYSKGYHQVYPCAHAEVHNNIMKKTIKLTTMWKSYFLNQKAGVLPKGSVGFSAQVQTDYS